MRDFRLRTDLVRPVINGFALPLGIEPGEMEAPAQGYTLAYTQGQDDEPDSYVFHVVVSHERVAPILHRLFDALPPRVFPIVEIGSRDAYRTTDIYIAPESIDLEEFRRTWDRFESILLEDGSIAAGANSEEPFVEIFLDQWKGVSIHVPLAMREEVEAVLTGFDLEEVVQTWPDTDQVQGHDETRVRPVLDIRDEFSPDVDELLLDLRHDWRLALNIDPDTNVDESGRRMGMTLWHAVVIVEATAGSAEGAYASVWATAGSLGQMEHLIEDALREHPQWSFSELYTIDRVAFDERPDELSSLAPLRRTADLHLVQFEPWTIARDDRA